MPPRPASDTVCQIYGIKNCSTMKKAFDWLEAEGIEYVFHDYKKTPPSRGLLQAWCSVLGAAGLVNTRGTTWRKLPPEKQHIDTDEQAIALMLEFPSLIKRPVLEFSNHLLVGFDPERFAACFKP